jgi:hypothetical protein
MADDGLGPQVAAPCAERVQAFTPAALKVVLEALAIGVHGAMCNRQHLRARVLHTARSAAHCATPTIPAAAATRTPCCR